MCDCELHQSAVGNCTCVCEDHDRYFSHGEVILRKAVRSLMGVSASVDRLIDRVDALGQPVEATLEVAERVSAIESHDLNKILERLDKIEDRLSPSDGEPVVWEDGKDTVATFDDVIFERDEARREVNEWKDRAIVAERKLRGVKEYFSTVDVTYVDEEHA
jgi:hypothetical protein